MEIVSASFRPFSILAAKLSIYQFLNRDPLDLTTEQYRRVCLWRARRDALLNFWRRDQLICNGLWPSVSSLKMQIESTHYVPAPLPPVAPIPPAPEKVSKLDKLLCTALGGLPSGTYYPGGTEVETSKRLQVDYVPLWARPPYNLSPLPEPALPAPPVKILDESVLPALAKEMRRVYRRLGMKIARVSIGSVPGGDGGAAPLVPIWERTSF